MQNVIK